MPLIDVPTVHAVTNTEILTDPGFFARAHTVAEALGTRGAIHLRGSGLEARRLFELAQRLGPVEAGFGCRIVVNDRPDIARATGAWATQITRRSLSIVDARKSAPLQHFGISIHSEIDARNAAAETPDWLLLGNVFPTSSHPGKPGLDSATVSACVKHGLTIAIGGIQPHLVGQLKALGCHGIAAISGIWLAPDPARAAASYC